MEQEGVLYHRVFHSDGVEEILQVMLPTALQGEVLTQLHQQHGHQGVECTTQLVCQRCYWPGMSSDIARWYQECERCQCAKGPSLAHSYMEHLMGSRPTEILAIDYMVLEPSWAGIENVMVMTNGFTRDSWGLSTGDQRAEMVAQVFVSEWFCWLGVPSCIHSNQSWILRLLSFSSFVAYMVLRSPTLHHITWLGMDSVST